MGTKKLQSPQMGTNLGAVPPPLRTISVTRVSEAFPKWLIHFCLELPTTERDYV